MSSNKTLMLKLEKQDAPDINYGPNGRPYVQGGGALAKAGGGKRAIRQTSAYSVDGIKHKARGGGHLMKTLKRMAASKSFHKNGGKSKGSGAK
jgi:hypothetical protein